MTNPTITLMGYLRKFDLDLDGDVLREAYPILCFVLLRFVSQILGRFLGLQNAFQRRDSHF